MTHDPTSTSARDRLLHRWFVQYNPTYFASAMLVLVGVILTSRGLAERGGWLGPLGGEGIAELYAFALIGAVAFLLRIGQRRPATLLTLVVALYQCDLTLHTETCPLMGPVGVGAAVLWWTMSAGKLALLAWALKVRITPRAWATATLGAAGLVIGPFVLTRCDASTFGIALALFVHALASMVPSARESVRPCEPLDDWSATITRRVCRAAWILWASALALHVGFWTTLRSIDFGACAVSAMFLAISRVRSEGRLWGCTAGVIFVAAAAAPGALSTLLLFAAITFARRAWRRVERPTTARAESSPYRENEPSPQVTTHEESPPETERLRAWSGAAVMLYLSIWLMHHHGGPLPAHSLALDALFVLSMGALAGWRRSWTPVVPTSAVVLHMAFARGWLPRPETSLDWGVTALMAGLATLALSLVMSYRLRNIRLQS